MRRLGSSAAWLRSSLLFVAVAATCQFLAPALPARAENAVIARSIEGFVRPAYGRFHEATTLLNTACRARPSPK